MVNAVVGANIRRERSALGISVKELAARSGYSSSMISQVETGKIGAPIELLCRIARELHVRAAELLDGADSYHREAEKGDLQ